MNRILFSLSLSGLLFGIACTPRIVLWRTPKDPTASPEASASAPTLTNPASVFCEQNQGILDIRTDVRGNQIGYCIFMDRTECEEWSYYQGKCAPGDHPSLR